MSKHLIARRHQFSSAHFYAQKRFDQAENVRVFGPCYTPHGHGHNYTLEAFVTGNLDGATGLVMNVTDLDIHMKKVCALFDHKHISFDVPEFEDVIPTTENLASFIFTRLEKELKQASPNLHLEKVRLHETDELWAEVGRASEVHSAAPSSVREAVCTVQVEIRSIHHLESKTLSAEENRKVYGICYGVHGHHYKVQVSYSGSIDEMTGLVFSRDEVLELINRRIVTPYDGVDLNRLFANTSCEALAKEFFDILKPQMQGRLVKVGIQETRKNYFEFPAGA
jgi:6-pyruvoyltetrahydropterin/6-carboxytetrahydropterin synthase